MKHTLTTIWGFSLALLAGGCGADTATEDIEQSSAAVTFPQTYDVYSTIDGVRKWFYGNDAANELAALGFPSQVWDSGSLKTSNSGTVCGLLPAPDSAWQCTSSSDFAGDTNIYIYTSGGNSRYPKWIRLQKAWNPSHWEAQWGTGTPGHSYIYHASYLWNL